MNKTEFKTFMSALRGETAALNDLSGMPEITAEILSLQFLKKTPSRGSRVNLGRWARSRSIMSPGPGSGADLGKARVISVQLLAKQMIGGDLREVSLLVAGTKVCVVRQSDGTFESDTCSDTLADRKRCFESLRRRGPVK